ncbi:hypothetical protein E8E12_011451 [Didymella heteroderae]|uniref:FAD-binding PCMH-type domain-containing protein n=1 Tax=Didymella heteroderae TaxID=1769908 RepID=A0A9P5C631_9PLEO|nr:hypothetical protein E8E12_011451 [Didymella heteroderae]
MKSRCRLILYRFFVLPAIVHVAKTSLLVDIKPATFRVAGRPAAGAPLQVPELWQLNDEIVARIAADEATKSVANYFTFDDRNPSSESSVASSCYDTKWGKKDSAQCANVVGNFANPYFHESDPTSIMWPIFQGRTCMPSNNTSGKRCAVGGYPEYAVKVTNVAQIQMAINFARTANLRLIIKNTGHCYLVKSSEAGALSLWMHNMQDIDFFPDYEGLGYSGPAMKLAAGVTVRQVCEAADKNNVTVTGAVSWSVGYAGGMIAGGGQNPLAGIYGMAADHVIAFNVVTADGRFRTVSQDSYPDLFWALRGGGGGTFAVVVSSFGTKKFFDEFLTWADAGVYSFFIMGNTPAPFLNMAHLFAPNHTLESYTELVTPFFEYMHFNNIILTTPHKSVAHDSFYSAYQAAWGSNNFPIGLDNSLPANRIVPRINFEEKFNETFALIMEHVSSGKHFLGYHKVPAKYGNIDNAVSSAWRKCAMFLVTSSNKSLDHSTPEALAIAKRDLQENILQLWRDISPVSEGGGTYLNEASIMEPDWQESFYGGYYEKLSEIKRKWDPRDVFYATTAVGSERWKS